MPEPGFFFQPRERRGFEMVYGFPKPRYSEQMESGVLYFVAPGKVHAKKYGIQSGNKSVNSKTKLPNST